MLVVQRGPMDIVLPSTTHTFYIKIQNGIALEVPHQFAAHVIIGSVENFDLGWRHGYMLFVGRLVQQEILTINGPQSKGSFDSVICCSQQLFCMKTKFVLTVLASTTSHLDVWG